MHTSEGGGICDCGDDEAFTRYFFLIFFYFLRTLFLFEYFQSLSLLNSRRTGKKQFFFPKYFLDFSLIVQNFLYYSMSNQTIKFRCRFFLKFGLKRTRGGHF